MPSAALPTSYCLFSVDLIVHAHGFLFLLEIHTDPRIETLLLPVTFLTRSREASTSLLSCLRPPIYFSAAVGDWHLWTRPQGLKCLCEFLQL